MTRTPAKPKLTFIESGELPGGRLEIWHDPEPGRLYAMGIDCALGLETSDDDYAVLLRDDGEQVAEVQGHFGETFGTVLDPLLDWYANVFLVPEWTKESAAICRAWYDAGRWIYYHRATQKRSNEVRDQLGHVPGAADITVHWLRRDLRERDLPAGQRTARHRLTVRSEELHSQLCKFRFTPPRGVQMEEARDKQLAWGAPAGEHDDGVRALALANAGLYWLPEFEQPKPTFQPGSFGAITKWGQAEPSKGAWRRK